MSRQQDEVLTRHLLALARRTGLLTGIDTAARVDVDSLLRPVYGHAKQGASFGQTKIATDRCCAKACRRWPSPSPLRLQRR